VARNLLEVAVALGLTEALLCHDLKNTDRKVRFCGHSGYLFFPFYLKEFVVRVLRMPICSHRKYSFYGFMIPEDMLMLVVNFIVDIR